MTERKSTIDKAHDAAEAREAQQAKEAQEREARATQERLAAQGGQLWEVLTEGPTGHRTVHRLRAMTVDAAVQAVTDADTDDELEVLDAGPAGHGLGSNDITPEQMTARLKDGIE